MRKPARQRPGALIAGTSGGIGAALARELARYDPDGALSTDLSRRILG